MKKKKVVLERNDDGTLKMSVDNLKKICQEDGLYQYLDWNTKIFLNFKVIAKIENLDFLKNLKALYLQNNVIKKIQNIDSLVHLQNLFLQNNLITRIQNLDNLKKLHTLDLSNNQILRIDNLRNLPSLGNLNLKSNYIKTADDIRQIMLLPNLTSFDISYNYLQITDSQQDNQDCLPNTLNSFVYILRGLRLKCLYLYQNPIVGQIKKYRQTIIGYIPTMLYLDQRNVTPQENRVSVAWIEGGSQQERKVKEDIRKQKEIRKEQNKIEIRNGLDKYRRCKINTFLRSIEDGEEHIQMLTARQLKFPIDYQFYQKQIDEEAIRIANLRQSVQSIRKRMSKQYKEQLKQQSISVYESIGSKQQIVIGSKSEASEQNSIAVNESQKGQMQKQSVFTNVNNKQNVLNYNQQNLACFQQRQLKNQTNLDQASRNCSQFKKENIMEQQLGQQQTELNKNINREYQVRKQQEISNSRYENKIQKLSYLQQLD